MCNESDESNGLFIVMCLCAIDSRTNLREGGGVCNDLWL